MFKIPSFIFDAYYELLCVNVVANKYTHSILINSEIIRSCSVHKRSFTIRKRDFIPCIIYLHDKANSKIFQFRFASFLFTVNISCEISCVSVVPLRFIYDVRK